MGAALTLGGKDLVGFSGFRSKGVMHGGRGKRGMGKEGAWRMARHRLLDRSVDIGDEREKQC